jgi:hypothetical protein
MCSDSAFRQEWQEAVNGKSLMKTEGSHGLILADLAKDFCLTTHEQTLVLGPELFTGLSDVLSMPAYN